MSKVSYSQYSVYSSCPFQYKLNYVDRLGIYESNIHLVFGSSMHETIQDFLEIMYGESKKQALEIDLDEQLLANMKTNFVKEQKRMDGKVPATQKEMEEFYGDGREILQYLRGKLNKFYPKSGYELVGIEVELKDEVAPNVFFTGFIDVALKDRVSGKIIIIDLKTSTKGWSTYEKNNKVKTSQMLLYKKIYSDKFDVSYNDITVEYHILKRKVRTDLEWTIPRISKFVPANGKPSVNKSWGEFMGFVSAVFDENGNRRSTGYVAKPSKLCDWCSFKAVHCNHWK